MTPFCVWKEWENTYWSQCVNNKLMLEIMTVRHKSWLLKFVDGNFMNIL
jgi:hypothetical protein